MIPNQWYVVLESRELEPGRLLGVTRMGERLVFARDRGGKAFCLRDRCAHRGAALSAGKHAGDAVDTNGCGDVFHGCYAAGLCEGWPIGRRVRYAAAAAAMKATRRGGQQGIPSRADADRFVADRPGEAIPREVA